MLVVGSPIDAVFGIPRNKAHRRVVGEPPPRGSIGAHSRLTLTPPLGTLNHSDRAKGGLCVDRMLVEESRVLSNARVRYALRCAAVFAAYVVAARLGLGMDAVAGVATTVWPPSGIALAALLLGGNSLWPAIALGAFTAN